MKTSPIITLDSCGCGIRCGSADDLFIDYCPKHKTASDMYELLKTISAMPRSHIGHWDKEGTAGANCPVCIKQSKALGAVGKVLAKAEGKEEK